MREIVTKVFRKQGIVRAFLRINNVAVKMWEQTKYADGMVQTHVMSKGNQKDFRTTRFVKELMA